MAKIYYEKDCNLELLKDKTIAVVGYGSQGHAHALNLKDSGLNVIVGLYEGSKSAEKAKKRGLKVMNTADAVKESDFIIMLVNDEKMAKIYKDDVQPNLRKGHTLAFAHGFNIHYGQIVPPEFVDVVMIAPKGPGHTVRSQYLEGKGVPCLVAVEKNPGGKALENALAYAAGIGGARAGILETTFKEETETDLFGEQVVLCGGLTELVVKGFETLVEAGYQPEVAYYECLHELKLIVDLLHEGGLSKMHQFISETAKYGDLTRGPRIVNAATKREMKKVLKEIQDGTFARQWISENKRGRKKYTKLMNQDLKHQIEKVGAKLRARMPWLEEARA